MEWDTKLSERTTKDVIQTKNDIKNKLLPLVFSSEAWTFFCGCLFFKRESFPDNCVDWTNENVSFGVQTQRWSTSQVPVDFAFWPL